MSLRVDNSSIVDWTSSATSVSCPKDLTVSSDDVSKPPSVPDSRVGFCNCYTTELLDMSVQYTSATSWKSMKNISNCDYWIHFGGGDYYWKYFNSQRSAERKKIESTSARMKKTSNSNSLMHPIASSLHVPQTNSILFTHLLTYLHTTIL